MWGLIIGLLIAIVIAAFASLNSAPVMVNFIFRQVSGIPLSLVILFSVLLGVIMAALLGVPGYMRSRRARKELEKKIKEQENKIRMLENIPGLKQASEMENEEKKKSETPPQD